MPATEQLQQQVPFIIPVFLRLKATFLQWPIRPFTKCPLPLLSWQRHYMDTVSFLACQCVKGTRCSSALATGGSYTLMLREEGSVQSLGNKHLDHGDS